MVSAYFQYSLDMESSIHELHNILQKSVPWWMTDLAKEKKRVNRLRRKAHNHNISDEERHTYKSDYRLARKQYTKAVSSIMGV